MGRVEEHSRLWGFSAESYRHSVGVSVARAKSERKERQGSRGSGGRFQSLPSLCKNLDLVK